MTGDRPTLEIIIQRLDQLQKMIDGFNAADKSSSRISQNMKEVKASIAQASTAMQTFQKDLGKSLGGRSLNSVMRNIAAGGPEVGFTAAVSKGEMAKMRATGENLAAEFTLGFQSTLRKRGKALEFNKMMGLSAVRQDIASTNRELLTMQINAQKLRVQLADEALGTNYNASGKRVIRAGAPLQNYTLESAALNNLTLKQQELVDLERLRRQEVQATSRASVQSARNFQQMAMPQRGTPSEGINNRLADPNYIPSLFKIQAALLGNYLVMGQIFRLFSFGSQFVMEFDGALKDLAAVTNTTDTQMVSLSKSLIDVARSTKFSAVEVARAATVMGQAGFSAKQIEESIKSVTLFATAVGTDLSQATDTVTSVISVFNLKMSDTEHIANVMTGAVNKTKLTVDKLQLGLQYAGNAAAQAGATFEELVSVLGAMANAGIRSGSTLGTGMRQIIIALQNPTDKFLAQLESVGLTAEDVNIRSKGLIGALQNLTKAGFGAENAFKAFEIRSASAYLAIANNIKVASQLEQELLLTNAAAEANAKQMQGITNVMKNFESQLGTAIVKGFDPLKVILTDVTRVAGKFLDVLSDIPFVLPALGSIFSGALLVVGFSKLFKLLGAIVNIRLGFIALTKSVVGFSVATKGATAAQVAFNAVAMPGVAWTKALAVGLSLLIGGYYAFGDSIETLTDKFDKQKAATDESRAALEKSDQTINSIDDNLNRLRDRYVELSKNSDMLKTETLSLQVQFGAMGLEIDKNVINPVDRLTEALMRLREETEAMRSLELEKLSTNLTAQQMIAAEIGAKAAGRVVSIGNSQWGLDVGILGNQSPTIKAIANKFGQPGGIQDRLGVLQNQQFDSMTSEEQSQYMKEAEELRVMVSRAQAATQKEINNIKATKGFMGEWASGLGKLNDMLEDINMVAAKVGDLESTAMANSRLAQEFATSLVTQSDPFRKAREDIKQLHQDFLNQYEAANQAEKDGDKAKKEKAIMEMQRLQKELNQLVLDFSIDNMTDFGKKMKEALATSGGFDPSSPEVAAAMDELAVIGKTTSAEMTGKLDTTAAQLAKGSEKLTKRFLEMMERIDLALNRATMSLDKQISDIDQQLSESKNLMSPLYGSYGDAQENILLKKQREMNIAKLEIQRRSLSQKVGAIQGELGQRSGASKIIGDNSDGRSTLSDTYKETTADLKKTNDLEQQLLNTRRELDEVTNKLTAMTGEVTQAQASLGEQLGDTIDDYKKTMAVQSQWRTSLRADVWGVLDEGRAAFKGFVTDWVTGAQSMGDAWRGFMRKVLESMLDKTTGKLADAFGGIAATALGSVWNMAAPSLGMADTSGIVWNTKQTGGMIRAAAGRYITTRDAVPVMAQDGEYMLRKSAVDSIGRDNLDMINAMGNRKISQSTPKSMQEREKEGTMVNVWVVSPDQKPPMGKNDIIAVIGDDMIRGGPTKKLVKAIAVGAM